MIIDCNNCNKKFELDADLIPKKGRLLECSSCNHKWFFKHEDLELFDSRKIIDNKPSDLKKSININNKKKNSRKKTNEITPIKKDKNVKKNNFLYMILVFIVSFIALIILIDTFKRPISIIIPNIEILLYNLYETFRDIRLFIKDLN